MFPIVRGYPGWISLPGPALTSRSQLWLQSWAALPASIKPNPEGFRRNSLKGVLSTVITLQAR